MDRMAQAPGLIGFRLFAVGGPRDPFAPVVAEELQTYRIWKHAAANDLVIWLYPPAAEVHLVPYLLEAFPGVRVVLNHLGVCPGEGRASRDDKGRPRIETPQYNPAFHTTYRFSGYENVAVKLSGQYAFSREQFPYRDLGRWHERLLACYGPRRLMWASDFPWICEDPGYGPLTTVVRELLPALSDSEHADIMGDTAQRFLRFPAC
jgi:predicted TIM-barrel fold metal-dependent hydrolase